MGKNNMLEAMSSAEKLELILSGIEDTGICCEYGLLLGSNPIEAKTRCCFAAKLYRKQRVKYLIASGGVCHDYKGHLMKECNFMSEMLQENGVPAEAIILEDSALTTKENMILGGLILNRKTKLVGINEIMIITSAWYMKRSLALAKCFLPRKIKAFGYPVPFSEDSELWLKSEDNRKRVDTEIRLIKGLEDNGIAEKNTLFEG